MVSFIIGRKLNMTSFFKPSGEKVAVTLVEAGPCTVVAERTKDKNGYKAAVLEYQLKRNKVLKEFRLDDGDEVNIGQQIKADIFQAGDIVQVTGISKGRGFAGVVKRWGFAGGPKTHGQSDRQRAPGSIGAGTTPGHVHKGKKMAGRMGGQRVTIKNLEVVKVDEKKNLIALKGGIPGSFNSVVYIRKLSSTKNSGEVSNEN